MTAIPVSAIDISDAGLLALAESISGGHLVLEEYCWYSCPKSGKSCRYDDRGDHPCDCDHDERVEKIRAALVMVRDAAGAA